MAVQINEVIIRAVVDSTPAPADGGTIQSAPADNVTGYELVEKVLEIIREKQER